jgi:hypothetical protein
MSTLSPSSPLQQLPSAVRDNELDETIEFMSFSYANKTGFDGVVGFELTYKDK